MAMGIHLSRGRRRACWLFGMLTLGLIAFFTSRSYEVLWVRYRMDRLERSETLDEAAKPFEALEQTVSRWPRARDAFIADLGNTRPRLTFWFFAMLDLERVSVPELLASFRKALGEREDLARSWSQFLRWRRGDSLWEVFDAVARGAIQSDEAWKIWWIGPNSPGLGTVVYRKQEAADASLNHLRNLGVLWFLGVPVLPASGEVDLTRELLLRPFIYNPARDRCEADLQMKWHRYSSSFTRLSKLVPGLPVPAWRGLVPTLPEELISIYMPMWRFYELYDGVWPPLDSDPSDSPDGLDEMRDD